MVKPCLKKKGNTHLPKKAQKPLVTMGAMGKDGGGGDTALRGEIVSLLFSFSFLSFFPSFLSLFFLPFFFSLPSFLSVHLSLFLSSCDRMSLCHHAWPGTYYSLCRQAVDLKLTELCLPLPPRAGTMPGFRTVFRPGTRTELPGGQ